MRCSVASRMESGLQEARRPVVAARCVHNWSKIAIESSAAAAAAAFALRQLRWVRCSRMIDLVVCSALCLRWMARSWGGVGAQLCPCPRSRGQWARRCAYSSSNKAQQRRSRRQEQFVRHIKAAESSELGGPSKESQHLVMASRPRPLTQQFRIYISIRTLHPFRTQYTFW
jgi:hypothetical protein